MASFFLCSFFLKKCRCCLVEIGQDAGFGRSCNHDCIHFVRKESLMVDLTNDFQGTILLQGENKFL